VPSARYRSTRTSIDMATALLLLLLLSASRPESLNSFLESSIEIFNQCFAVLERREIFSGLVGRTISVLAAFSGSSKSDRFASTASRRFFAIEKYFGSISVPMLFRPACNAAIIVDPVPRKGSSTVSSTNENIRTSRFATSTGNGAGCSFVDAPVTSVHIERNQTPYSSFDIFDFRRWSSVGLR